MDNVRSVPLYVFTVDGLKDDAFYSELIDIASNYESWVLDIDLDFFSTLNPYKDCFTSVP